MLQNQNRANTKKSFRSKTCHHCWPWMVTRLLLACYSGCLRMVLAKFDMFLVFEPYVRSSSRSSSPTGSWFSTYNIPTSRVNTTKRFFERGLVPTSLMLKFVGICDSKTSPSRAAFVWTHKIFPDRWHTLPHPCGATSCRADELPV